MTDPTGGGASHVAERTRALRVTYKWTVCLTVLSWLSATLWPRSAYAEGDQRKRECFAAYSEAQEQRLRSALLAAREQLLLCSRDDCPGQIVRDCSEWLSHVERDLSSVVFAVSDQAGRGLPAARVLINGEPLAEHAARRAQLLDPGAYQYSVELDGYERAEGTIVMRQSEKNRIVRIELSKPHVVDLRAKLPPPSAESDSGFHVPIAAIVLGATAVVGVAGFTYFGLSGQAKRSDAEQCSGSCAELIDSGKRDYIVADISLGVAVVAAGTALLITLLDQSPSPPQAAQNTRAQTTARDFSWSVRF
jgi:hypothetical protein